jgi:hypothetical protein
MTDRDAAVIAGLEAVLDLLKRPEYGERYHPLPEVARRLGFVAADAPDDCGKDHEAAESCRVCDTMHAATEQIRRDLRNQLPVVKIGRRLVVREESLNTYIRKREALERRSLKSA